MFFKSFSEQSSCFLVQTSGRSWLLLAKSFATQVHAWQKSDLVGAPEAYQTVSTYTNMVRRDGVAKGLLESASDYQSPERIVTRGNKRSEDPQLEIEIQ